jgi:hypothetical protein
VGATNVIGSITATVSHPTNSSGQQAFEVLVELGSAQLSAGDGAGFRTLRAAVDHATDPRAAAQVALAVSRAARSGGSYRPAEDTVVAAIATLGDTEPDLLADLHTELAIAGRGCPGPTER